MADPQFRRDLYQGAALDYDRFRPPYPQQLITDLALRSGASGAARLLDLACGTGQISFALHGHVGQVWAVDHEPDMISVARGKAGAAGIATIAFLTCAAEALPAPDAWFDLVAIGNAFHRLRREQVAERVLRWLRPGGYLALLWGGSPWDGEEPWQRALAATMRRWQDRVADRDRIPAGYEQARTLRPDLAVLRQAGFQLAGRYEFPAVRVWTPEDVVGYMYSTSVLSRAVLGGQASEFAAELTAELRACEPDGRLRQTIRFAYDLARRPATVASSPGLAAPLRSAEKQSSS